MNSECVQLLTGTVCLNYQIKLYYVYFVTCAEYNSEMFIFRCTPDTQTFVLLSSIKSPQKQAYSPFGQRQHSDLSGRV
jgi:hypothetical protein